MSTRNSRRKPISEINVVPYIDVMLVLLVIFMVTAPLQQSGVEVDLPVASGSPVEQNEKPPVIISIKEDGQYYLSETGDKALAVLLDDLLLRIVAIYNENPQVQIYIRGDKAVDYGNVVSVMAALKQAGVARVGLMTTPDEQ
ncbi:MAG: protein TolR [Methylococcaceae bacterium]|nr:protein TolR [Methylococcaceae bacterium]